jgi:hypothetical protein
MFGVLNSRNYNNFSKLKFGVWKMDCSNLVVCGVPSTNFSGS